MRHIVLIGFMGSGKTKTGRLLAEELGYRFVDVDKKITAEMKMSVTDIFSRFGEVFFRALETKAIKELLQLEECAVISVGGGLPVQKQNHKYLKQLGAVIYLKGSVETLKKRLEGDRTRPLLEGADLEGKIRKMLAAREPVYEKLADVTVITGQQPMQQLVQEIVKKWKEYEIQYLLKSKSHV